MRDRTELENWHTNLQKYAKSNFSFDDLLYMIGCADAEIEPDSKDLDWLEDKTSLLPPKLLPQLDEERLIRLAPKLKPTPLRDTVITPDILNGVFTDADFLSIFPPRSKIDLAIRRARIKTVWLIYKHDDKIEEWRKWLPLLINFDYVTVMNALLFHSVHGYNWLDFWQKFGCLTSLDDLQSTTKWVSDKLKKHPAPMELRLRYCEAGGISGFRNPPFGKFDFFAESKSLADGGEPHGWGDWESEFNSVSEQVQGSSVVDPVEFITLEEFIAKDLASTKGASTFGKVEWEFDGEKGKFKARKNFLLDIASPEYLAEQTWANLGKQVNKSFIKAELGKMRIAVTGDIWTYFSQAYLNYLCNGVYLQWPGNTLDEGVVEQAQRMWDMFTAARNQYGLPFDFAGFDHQPEKDEVKVLVGKYLVRGRSNVPSYYQEKFDKLLSGTVAGFDNSVMVAREGEKVEEYNIKGGVQSGIRLTSLLGNYWNGVMTTVCKNKLSKIGLGSRFESWLRGDDSAIFSRTYWDTLLFRLMYEGINAVGNDSKYGIHFEQSEFLRVWYADRAYGYPNRAIPSITQRKPWSSDPWDPEGVLKSQLITVDTLERRMQTGLPTLRKTVKQDWSRIRKQQVRWLQVPSTLGGLGLAPFEGWVADTYWPKVPHPDIEMGALAGSEMRFEERFKEWNPNQAELIKIQQNRMNSKAQSDDIRGLGAIYREEYKASLVKIGTAKWRRVDVRHFPKIDGNYEVASLAGARDINDLKILWKGAALGFGNFRSEEAWFSDVTEFSRVRKISPIKELKKRNPACFEFVRKLERKGLHRATALDFAFGKLTGLQMGTLHPLLSHVIERRLAAQVLSHKVKWTRETFGWFQTTLSTNLANIFGSSPLVKKLFLW